MTSDYTFFALLPTTDTSPTRQEKAISSQLAAQIGKIPSRFGSRFRLVAMVGFLALTSLNIFAADKTPLPFVSPMFGNNMVLQRNKPNRIWGWAKPGQEVRVSIADVAIKTVTGNDGRWQIEFNPPPVGGPYTLTVDGAQHVEFREVLVGDVWLCGGQSNMAMGMGMIENSAEEIKAADHPKIRFFMAQEKFAYAPKPQMPGTWKVCSPQTVAADGWNGFSAAAYYFACKLQRELNVPIGLVESCWGGTSVHAWISADGLKSFPEYVPMLDVAAKVHAAGGEEYDCQIWSWFAANDPHYKDWFAPTLDDSNWPTVTIPGGFKDLGVKPESPAVVYFRKVIELPNPLPAGDAMLHLGQIERMDTAQFNGVQVGASDWVQNPRKYNVGHWLLKPGKNVIVVRVFRTAPDGGFQSPAATLKLILGNGKEIPLAGEWKGQISVTPTPQQLPGNYSAWPPNMPGCLYNAMIAPAVPLAISGAIWYQGEANTSRALQYRELLPTLIADWRKQFAQGDFPFYIVSLAAFMPHKDDPNAPDDWAELRAAQDLTARTVKNTGLAVTIDIGDAADIHPKNKRDVGNRLALIALDQHYGKKQPFSGPQFAKLEKIPGGLKIHFTHADGGLSVKGEKLEEFAICGADKKWHWANAKIEGDTVVVSSPEVPQPVAVKYAWQANPKATLFNGAGLPAVPFQTNVVLR